jgi:hypothetical protein
VAALPKPKQESEGTAFSVLHGGTVYDQEALWPWSKAVFDPMHGMHYEGNVLLDESVQLPLAAAEDLDPAAKADVLQATEEINTLWRGYNFPKYIQFGKDGAGSRFKHLDGPTWKGALRSNVLKKTYEIMREKVYPLLEVREGTWKAPAVTAQVADELVKGSGRARKKAAKKVSKQRSRKQRPVRFGDSDGDSSDEEDADTGASAGEAQTPAEHAAQATRVRELTYAERTGAAWTAFITLYEYMHEGHDVQLKDLPQAERERKGEYAAELALDMERAMLALIGSYRRRTYAHDLVYGIYDLYVTFGKPWAAATEGNEHLHQDMKQYFSHMCCHNGKGKDGDVLQVLKLMYVRQHVLEKYGKKYLPNSEYACMRANRIGTERTSKKKGKTLVGEKKYSIDVKMKENKDELYQYLCQDAMEE